MTIGKEKSNSGEVGEIIPRWKHIGIYIHIESLLASTLGVRFDGEKIRGMRKVILKDTNKGPDYQDFSLYDKDWGFYSS